MKPDLDQEEALFTEALTRLPAEWTDFLQRSCGGDRALHDRLAALLALHARAGDFLENRGGASVAEALGQALLQDGDEKLTGAVIGPYTLKERLGEGGVGVVYRAEQSQPIQREVALKVIKPGMDTREVLLRFAAERQALAVMDHPGIARVIDAGATAQGRPYFAMELVRGIPITAFCDARKLPLAARLTLFRRVCEAVQHAHQKGIIHRDLKPSNILVVEAADGTQPKIIDFGIAKATAGHDAGGAAVTTVAHFIGTPAYMSPEQAAGRLDLDTRSDIYSLGVLLHELLTGAPPFETRETAAGGIDELRRRIREDEPAPPSVAFGRQPGPQRAAAAVARSSDERRLTTALRGDLDRIVRHCLEKEPARRYPTANGLAEDIRRHLADEPVVAAPPDRLYRLGKAIRRNRGLYASGAAVFVALVIATIVSLSLAVRARRAERLAGERAQAEAQARLRAEEAERQAAAEAATSAGLSEFLRHDLLAQASPEQQPDRDVKLRTVVDRAAERLKDRFPDAPLVRADVRETLADTYQALGEYAAMRDQCERALTLRREVLGPDHLDTLRIAVKLYDSLPVADKIGAEGEELGRDTLERLTRTVGEDHPLALQLRVALHKIMYRGRYSEAEPLLRSSLEDARRVLGTDNPVTLSAMSDYAVVLAELERLEEAAAVAEEAIGHMSRVYGAEHPQTLPAISRLATIYSHLGRHAQARALAEKLLAVRTTLLGAEHPQTLTAATVLGGILVRSQAHAEAEPLLRATGEALRRRVGADHPATLNVAVQLAIIRFDAGHWEEAETLLTETLEILRRKFGPGYSDSVNAAVLRGRIAAARGDWGAATGYIEPAIDAARSTIGANARITLSAMHELAMVRAGSGRGEEAVALMREVGELRLARWGANHPDTMASKDALERLMAAASKQDR